MVSHEYSGTNFAGGMDQLYWSLATCTFAPCSQPVALLPVLKL